MQAQKQLAQVIGKKESQYINKQDGRRFFTVVNYLPDQIDFSQYMRETDAMQKLKKVSVFIEDAKEKLRFRATGKRTFLPWVKCNGSFEFRSGEMTMWAGQNGHGKTDITTQVALSLLGQDEKVCVASFELKPVTTIEKMSRMYAGTNIFAEAYRNDEGYKAIDEIYDEFSEWTGSRFWLYDQTGNTDADTVYGMVKYCAKELGITHIFIDSMMKCIRDEDDYNAQKNFVVTLFAIAQDYNIHVHLVHHLKKPQGGESEKPDKHSTKGSGSITDIVDNLMLVWRNKPKEEEGRVKGTSSTKLAEADTIIYCRKQRNYLGMEDGEPNIGLWRNRDAGCFVETEGDPAPYYVNYPHRATP